MSWQPIETAPTDGTRFLVAIGNGRISVGFFLTPRVFAADSLGSSGNTNPIAWQPLPIPPEPVK